MVNYQITFAPHAPADTRSCDSIQIANDIPKAIALRFMAGLMIPQRLHIGIGQIVLCRNRSVLKNILNRFLRTRAFGKLKRIRRNVIAKAHDINSLTVLRYAEVF